MSIKSRFIACCLSVLLAFGIVAISGAVQPAAKALHNSYAGVLTIFILLFLLSMFLIMRGRLLDSRWSILITAALAYPSASFAYLAYFATFENERFINTLKHTKFVDSIPMLFVIGPTISFVWLFGALAGFTFLVLRRVLRTYSE